MFSYYSLNDYCKDNFKEKVYRLSLNGGMTCPNRDGFYSTGGCIFCSEGGSGDFSSTYSPSISHQIAEAKTKIQKKSSCNKFIAYFQAYTNTYASVAYLRKIFTEAIAPPEIVALSIGTRCDCLSKEILELLHELAQIKPVWIELGLQTIHNSTHAYLNTHTTLEKYDYAIQQLKNYEIPVITHVILGLPGENRKMMLETIQHVAKTKTFGIKLQLLHVLKNTKLEELYLNTAFPIFTMEEYCDLIVDCLELLPPSMVIHRLTGDGPRNLLIAPLWSTDKKRVLNTIHKKLKDRNSYQGRLFHS